MVRLAAFAACLWLAGCKGEPAVHPTGGTVKFPDGTPATGCIVEFTSQAGSTRGMNARGEVQADGSFQLRTYVNGHEKDGAVAGPHKVTVVGPPAGSSGPAPLVIPAKYADLNASGLSFEVLPGAVNSYPITLDRK